MSIYVDACEKAISRIYDGLEQMHRMDLAIVESDETTAHELMMRFNSDPDFHPQGQTWIHLQIYAQAYRDLDTGLIDLFRIVDHLARKLPQDERTQDVLNNIS